MVDHTKHTVVDMCMCVCVCVCVCVFDRTHEENILEILKKSIFFPPTKGQAEIPFVLDWLKK